MTLIISWTPIPLFLPSFAMFRYAFFVRTCMNLTVPFSVTLSMIFFMLISLSDGFDQSNDFILLDLEIKLKLFRSLLRNVKEPKGGNRVSVLRLGMIDVSPEIVISFIDHCQPLSLLELCLRPLRHFC